MSTYRVWAALIGTTVVLLNAEQAPLSVSLCDVLANPQKFDGEFLEIRSEQIAGRHSGGLFDATCKGFILTQTAWEEERERSPRSRGYFACDSERLSPAEAAKQLAWHPPIPARPVIVEIPDQAWHQVERALGDRHKEDRNCQRNKVVATVAGRFDYEPCNPMWSRSGPDTEPKLIKGGYGAMYGARARIVIRSIRDVVIGPVNECWAEAEKKVWPPAK